MEKRDHPAANWILDPVIVSLIRRKSRQLSKLPAFSQSDRPDLEQELTLDLLMRFGRFDPAKSSAATFASRLIEHKAASLVRRARAKKRGFGCAPLSLHAPQPTRYGRTLELAATVDGDAIGKRLGKAERRPDARAALSIDVREAKESLPPAMRKLAALLSHVSAFAAGEILGLSRRQTAIQVAALKDQLERRGLNAS